MSDQDASQAQGEVRGWIVGNNIGQWRTFDSFGWAWTDRRDLAVRYARREDAELVHGEDEDSWRVEQYPAPGATAQEGAEVQEVRDILCTDRFGCKPTPTPTIPAGMVADDALREAMLIHAERCEAEVRLVPPAYTRNQWVSKESARLLRLAAAPKQAEQQGVEIARLFHDTYERLAPSFGYETRADTKAFDPDSPNGKLMTAVCGYVAAALNATTAVEKERGA